MNSYAKTMLYLFGEMGRAIGQKRPTYKNEKVSCLICELVFIREMFSNRACCSAECYKKLEIKQKDRAKIKRLEKKK
jgi:hypothetical protein